MCIAIVKTAGAKISDIMLRYCFQSNPDGAGFSYTENGKVVAIRGLMDFETFLTTFREHEKGREEQNFTIHFRIGTSGSKTADNTHPFMGKECSIIHNGVMFGQPRAELRSDTRQFVEDNADVFTKERVLKKLDAIGTFIGGGNKLVFLFNDGDFAIANEHMGDWDGGIWYSHGGYRRGKALEAEAAAKGASA